MLLLGIDIGSTTAKAVLRRDDEILYQKYERHYSQVREKTAELLREAGEVAGDEPVAAAISGSAGLGLAEAAGLPFVQEVFATAEVVREKEPDASCVIELGGEDAKIIFFDNGIDERMNGSCAGGTGAFIDQMATLLNVSVDELDKLSLSAERIYPIASRCGVFAKTDIQPLLNQGARKEDVAASIFQAVANQTIAGLAQGRRIAGKVLFLGGPLYYCKGLRKRFKETLKLSDEQAVFPEYGRYAVAYGAGIYAEKSGIRETVDRLTERVVSAKGSLSAVGRLEPLFRSEAEYEEFKTRHAKAQVEAEDINSYSGAAYLGIDCGSTTTKLVLLSADNKILYSFYASNEGNPVEIVRAQLKKIYELCGDRITLRGSAVTGYGEELIRHAFSVDIGLVETIAHYTAAKFFEPRVDFILDIGGQDIKCFRIKNGAIDSIMLNEACSSGCGSFLQTFAKALGCDIEEFARKGLFGKAPVNLGSRCTVFMNSSVKQSQKDGASIEDISAGLSISVVKNAIYKVIRASSAEELGKYIVVQGGTFYNDAVLRAFERELGNNVIRPSIAGLMGAYGAALTAKKCKSSTIISREELERFVHTSRSAVCNGCTNHCHLTVNKFGDGKQFISGNQCEKGAGIKSTGEPLPDLHAFKRDYLLNLKSNPGKRAGIKIGLPLALGMYELLPLWHGIFDSLGFTVMLSGMSDRRIYEKGQFSIPSDTACYPAKIMHGHIEKLIENGADAIFYPCLTYNIDEHASDNHYNCPVVAYYPEVLSANVKALRDVKFIYDYLGIHRRKDFTKKFHELLNRYFGEFKFSEVSVACNYAYQEYEKHMHLGRMEGKKYLRLAKEEGKPVLVLAGRPYHLDPEINHGINKLICDLGAAVITEDSISDIANHPKTKVLNQWMYHSRMYAAAQFVADAKDPALNLVQLVSFGCGVDAITTDEVRRILEEQGKIYTQIKIDEITNLGAVKIRLRSLFAASGQKGEK